MAKRNYLVVGTDSMEYSMEFHTVSIGPWADTKAGLFYPLETCFFVELS